MYVLHPSHVGCINEYTIKWPISHVGCTIKWPILTGICLNSLWYCIIGFAEVVTFQWVYPQCTPLIS